MGLITYKYIPTLFFIVAILFAITLPLFLWLSSKIRKNINYVDNDKIIEEIKKLRKEKLKKREDKKLKKVHAKYEKRKAKLYKKVLKCSQLPVNSFEFIDLSSYGKNICALIKIKGHRDIFFRYEPSMWEYRWATPRRDSHDYENFADALIAADEIRSLSDWYNEPSRELNE
jgi:hypothetical protein